MITQVVAEGQVRQVQVEELEQRAEVQGLFAEEPFRQVLWCPGGTPHQPSVQHSGVRGAVKSAADIDADFAADIVADTAAAGADTFAARAIERRLPR